MALFHDRFPEFRELLRNDFLQEENTRDILQKKIADVIDKEGKVSICRLIYQSDQQIKYQY